MSQSLVVCIDACLASSVRWKLALPGLLDCRATGVDDVLPRVEDLRSERRIQHRGPKCDWTPATRISRIIMIRSPFMVCVDTYRTAIDHSLSLRSILRKCLRRSSALALSTHLSEV